MMDAEDLVTGAVVVVRRSKLVDGTGTPTRVLALV
jgi:hypothetical protein